jgi:hypothetical protein
MRRLANQPPAICRLAIQRLSMGLAAIKRRDRALAVTKASGFRDWLPAA